MRVVEGTEPAALKGVAAVSISSNLITTTKNSCLRTVEKGY